MSPNPSLTVTNLKVLFINPFYSSVTFLYPLKTSENLWLIKRTFKLVTVNDGFGDIY